MADGLPGLAGWCLSMTVDGLVGRKRETEDRQGNNSERGIYIPIPDFRLSLEDPNLHGTPRHGYHLVISACECLSQTTLKSFVEPLATAAFPTFWLPRILPGRSKTIGQALAIPTIFTSNLHRLASLFVEATGRVCHRGGFSADC